MKKNIAILGATSHIAKGLILNFSNSKDFELFLFARDTRKLGDFLEKYLPKTDIEPRSIDLFNQEKYDVVINCVGLGTPSKVASQNESIFSLTEKFDNIILNYIEANQDCLYINFSSGAAYCFDYEAPADENSVSNIPVNTMEKTTYYGLVKLYTEAKHRSLAHLSIVDLRVFSYFSRFIDEQAGFLLTDIIDSIRNKKIFKTNSANIVRDYVHPNDLFSIILKCIDKGVINTCFDVYSAKPVSKLDVIGFFKENYRLDYEIGDVDIQNVTGLKKFYFSNSKKAAQEIGYDPMYSSLDCIKDQAVYFFEGSGNHSKQ